MSKQRLDKIIASQGAYSRSEVKALVKAKRVLVNGVAVSDPGFKADPDTDEITVDGKKFGYSEFVYIMLNKPKGVVSASNSPNDKTVIDLLPGEMRRSGLFPAGRLDKDTTGFVLITDDGEFAHEILSPKNHIEKTYEARLAQPVDEKQLEMVADGIVLGDGTECLPAKLRVVEDTDNPLVEIKIYEGKYHQIKRMFAAAGNGVIELKRTMMGALPLDDRLAEGECRRLTDEELLLVQQKSSE